MPGLFAQTRGAKIFYLFIYFFFIWKMYVLIPLESLENYVMLENKAGVNNCSFFLVWFTALSEDILMGANNSGAQCMIKTSCKIFWKHTKGRPSPLLLSLGLQRGLQGLNDCSHMLRHRCATNDLIQREALYSTAAPPITGDIAIAVGIIIKKTRLFLSAIQKRDFIIIKWLYMSLSLYHLKD